MGCFACMRELTFEESVARIKNNGAAIPSDRRDEFDALQTLVGEETAIGLTGLAELENMYGRVLAESNVINPPLPGDTQSVSLKTIARSYQRRDLARMLDQTDPRTLAITPPASQMQVSRYNTPFLNYLRSSQNSSMFIIGDGPGAMIAAPMCESLGYERVVVYGRSSEPGGIWKQQNVLTGGHNTYSSISALGHDLEVNGYRKGDQLRNFLSKVGGKTLNRCHQRVEVTGMEYDRFHSKYVVYGTDMLTGREVKDFFDCGFIATGNAKPKPKAPIGGPIETNLVQVKRACPDIRVKYWQEEIHEVRWNEYAKNPPVVVGLGNSAIEILRQAIERNIKVYVLTHLPLTALVSPQSDIVGVNQGYGGPLARSTADLTKLALDIPEVNKIYNEALQRGWIIPSVEKYIVSHGEQPRIDGVTLEIQTGDGRNVTLKKVPVIYSLIGYQNDPDLMRRLNLRMQDSTRGILKMDPFTNRVQTTFSGDPGRIYALGTAAGGSHEVIPVIMNDVPNILLGDMARQIGKIALGGYQSLSHLDFGLSMPRITLSPEELAMYESSLH